jgi:hypothetical protein
MKYVDEVGEAPRIIENMQQGFGFWLGGQGFDYATEGAYTLQKFLNNAAEYGYQQGGGLRSVSAFLTEGAGETFGSAGKVLDPDVTSIKSKGGAVVFLSLDLTTGEKGKGTKTVAKSLVRWPGPEGGNQIINGIEYADHVLARMAPKGYEYIDAAGRTVEGRGIPTTVVENAMQFGKKIVQEGGEKIMHAYDDVRVITNKTLDRVVTVWQQTRKGVTWP